MRDSKRDTDVKNRLLDSVGEAIVLKKLFVLLQILKADEHEETKETILPETEETKSQIEEKVFCPSMNRAITSGMWNEKCGFDKY